MFAVPVYDRPASRKDTLCIQSKRTPAPDKSAQCRFPFFPRLIERRGQKERKAVGADIYAGDKLGILKIGVQKEEREETMYI